MSKALEKLLEEIEENTEWLHTTEDDEVECISVENLKGLLKKYKISFNTLKLNPAQDREWEKAFSDAKNNGASDKEADKIAFAHLCTMWPELRDVEKIK